MNIIDKYQHKKQGYNPFLITPNWQVAQLNHAPEEELKAIERLDIHHKTDEVFFLIEGTAVLIAAEISGDSIDYDIQVMQAGITYNIRKNVWHNIAMYPGSKVLIVEDANTHLPLPEGDYAFHYLNEKQKQELQNRVNNLLNRNQ